MQAAKRQHAAVVIQFLLFIKVAGDLLVTLADGTYR
jgi:hypothetical protein